MDRTYFEIKRQYKTLERTFQEMESRREEIKNFYAARKPQKVVFLGSGSSFNLAQSAELIARIEFGIRSASLTAGDAMVNFSTYTSLFSDSLVVAVTRSGNTTEILNTVRRAKNELRLPVVGVTCAETSGLDGLSDLTVRLPWAFDECVCQTGTISNLYAATALLISAFAENNGVFCELKNVIASGGAFFEEYEPKIKQFARKDWTKAVVLADGVIFGLANEAALAFKEISGTVSNCHNVLDVRHGPMVLIDGRTLVVAALKTENKNYQLKLIGDLARKGATVIAVTDMSYDIIADAALHCRHIRMGRIAEGLPLLNVVQIIAYYKAHEKGLDPGNPDGLDAWINLDEAADE